MIIREYCELYASDWITYMKWISHLKLKTAELNHKEIENLNRHITSESESVSKNLTKKTS